MSYNINDGIRELERETAVYWAIRERFPDAVLDNQRFWVSSELQPEQCDHVQIGPNDVVRVGTLVGGQMVALPLSRGVVTTAVMLKQLQAGDPERFSALAQFIATHLRT
jgi:hypothetical protein